MLQRRALTGRPLHVSATKHNRDSRKAPAIAIVRTHGASQAAENVGGKGGTRTLDPAAGIGDDESHAFEPAILQVSQESSPALQILLLTLGHADDLPKPIGADADRDQHRDVAHLTGPTPLEDHPIEIYVGKLPDDLAVAPRFDVPVDLLAA